MPRMSAGLKPAGWRPPSPARARLPAASSGSWAIVAAGAATLALLGYLLNGNLRYQVGVGRVSGYSVAETFSHRPIAFRLLSAAQAWLPDLLSGPAGPPGSWWRVVIFEAGFRLMAAVLAAGAAMLLWAGLRRHWGRAGRPCAIAVYAALVFTAPATGEPDWMAALLATAAVGAGLAFGPRLAGATAGPLLALAALVKISTLPVAAAALLILCAFDRRRGRTAGAVATLAGLLAVGLTYWLAPYEIGWLLDIRALQPDPWDSGHAVEAGHYLMNLVARWPTVAMLPAYFVGARRDEAWVAGAGLALTGFGFVYQGQYFVYHSLGFVVLSAALAVRTLQRSRGALRWPMLALTAWTLVLFVSPGDWRVAHPVRLYLIAGGWIIALTAWQWFALRRPPTRTHAAGDRWAALLVMAAMLATQTPFSAESLTLSTADRTSWGAHRALRSELADAERIHRLIGTDTPVAYLTFGATTYIVGNPTRCRYPSPLFLQRPLAREKVSSASRAESLGCLTDPDARWLVWDRDWLRRKSAPDDLLQTIDRHWDCAAARIIGGYTICPRRT